MNNCKDLQALISKHMQKRNKKFKQYVQDKKEPNALLKRNFQKFVKNKKRRKIKKQYQNFQ